MNTRDFAGHISLCTDKCVMTGEPSRYFTGHVLAVDCYGNYLTILAGFKDEHTLSNARLFTNPVTGNFGYYGPWKPEYGIRLS